MDKGYVAHESPLCRRQLDVGGAPGFRVFEAAVPVVYGCGYY